METANTFQSICAWLIEDQLDLVFRVWDQIVEQGWLPKPSEELKAELDRRLASHQADPSRALSWEQVVAHVRRPR